MKKSYILDTNVILYSPNALETFEDNDVILPSIVLEELDHFKSHYDLRGFAARQFTRKLEELRQKGDLINGVELKSGGRIFVKFADERTQLPHELTASGSRQSNDNLILSVALQVKEHGSLPTVMVSKDINVRIKASLLGIKAEDYWHNKTFSAIEQDGAFIYVNDQYINDLNREKTMPVAGYRSDGKDFEPVPSEYCILKSETNLKHSALARYGAGKDGLRSFTLLEEREDVFGIRPLNYKQRFLADAILSEDIDLIFVMGIAGSGKTLLSLAAALELVLTDRYKRLIVARPIIPLGPDPGALPGGELEKVRPWLQPIYDNLEFIMDNFMQGTSPAEKEFTVSPNQLTMDYLMDMKKIEIQPLAYIRGRSVPNSIFLIDEAQNLTPHEVKTIITRAGMNTKIILNGDTSQIDSPYMTPTDNGLVVTSEKFRIAEARMATTIFLDKGERSELATLAASIL